MHPLIRDVPGLADLLQISPTSAARRAREGTVPGVKIGREWRFWVPAVVAVVTGTAGARADEARDDVPVPDMVHAEELAEVLGVHANTLRLLFRQGRVPGRRVGGTWVAHWPTVCRWIANGEQRSDAAGPRPGGG